MTTHEGVAVATFDYSALNDSMAVMQHQVSKFIDQIQIQLQLQPTAFISDEMTYFSGITRPKKATAQPRQVTREQILAGLEQVVARAGEDFIATSHSTNHSTLGRRCVQGELMLALGWKSDEDLPGSYDGVTILFCRDDDDVVYQVLEKAEVMNDSNQPWGEILTMAKRAFAKAA